MRKSEYKRHDDLVAWDLNAGCRHIVNQNTPARRKLKKKLRRKARKTLDNDLNKWYNEDTNEGGQESMRDAKRGTYNGEPTYCPVNGYGDCPYCDQLGVCHIDDPQEDCDDWATFWDSWEDWLAADDIDPCAPTEYAGDEIRWAGDVYGYEDTWEDNAE